MQSICVFCGSSKGNNPEFVKCAEWLGAELASRKISLIYGGGKVGLMGAIADACMSNGGKVFGIIPKFLAKDEIAHDGLTELIQVESMHERKLKMSQLADGFITLPGGYGTLDELCEMLTWVQLALVSKPIGVINIDGYYDPLITQFHVMILNGLLKEINLKYFVQSSSGKDLLEKMLILSTEVASFRDRFIHT